MKLEDIIDDIFIDPRKLTHYALNLESLHGKHKAIVFQKVFNYNQDNYNHLLEQIQNKALNTEAFFHSKDNYGSRYTVDIAIEGFNKKKGTVRTGWFILKNSKQARLATIYVLKEKK
ncbi:MAG: hypothetical protein OMM_09044 [Candidatus Magnetoglobus multicellularis str. Araruama]|uniref:DUF6883 domain-containing protein n=1 Tax=Candidatus Magnetoglobus multicellularis str. Araruama TaxID=890399 RepID=A0A1V1P5N9_9BACT|nr:MAG: hypothetical protein OMM_09044 [Candidatus Magnetoglobus multicellularis str. Araruama]